MMRVYLDDTRAAPEGWVLARTAEQAVTLLQSGEVEVISLDHDLGEDERTGYDVLRWIEQQAAENGYKPPIMLVHSQNPVGVRRMVLTISRIEKFHTPQPSEDSVRMWISEFSPP